MRALKFPFLFICLVGLRFAAGAQTGFAAHADSVARADARRHEWLAQQADSLARADAPLKAGKAGRKRHHKSGATDTAKAASDSASAPGAGTADSLATATPAPGIPAGGPRNDSSAGIGTVAADDAARPDSSKTVKKTEGNWRNYRVQPGHSYAINTRAMLTKKKKASLEYNLADFYLYRNGELVKPPKHASIDFFPTGCLCFKYDDTLLLNSGLGTAVGIGVGIKIFEGKFTGTLHANLRQEAVYKVIKSDSVYVHSLTQEPETQSLKLSRAPNFISNEVITGEYEATYKAFYEKDAHDRDELRRYTVRIVFRCKVTGGIDSMKSLKSVSSK